MIFYLKFLGYHDGFKTYFSEPCLNVSLNDLVINKFKNANYFCHEGHIPVKKLAEEEKERKNKKKMGHSDEWVRQGRVNLSKKKLYNK